MSTIGLRNVYLDLDSQSDLVSQSVRLGKPKPVRLNQFVRRD